MGITRRRRRASAVTGLAVAATFFCAPASAAGPQVTGGEVIRSWTGTAMGGRAQRGRE